MKKILRIITALSVFFFLASGATSFAKKHPGKPDKANHVGITYVIKITNPHGDGLCNSYYVVIKDENGNQVTESLLYHEGIDTYIFFESGPKTGARIAYLEKADNSKQYFCNNILLTQPDQITGEFRDGSVYFFQLSPDTQARKD